LVWVRNWIETPICLSAVASVVKEYVDIPKAAGGVMIRPPVPDRTVSLNWPLLSVVVLAWYIELFHEPTPPSSVPVSVFHPGDIPADTVAPTTACPSGSSTTPVITRVSTTTFIVVASDTVNNRDRVYPSWL
jgi:hypothetical protein